MAFHINITQLYMCAGNKLELLMMDTHLVGFRVRPILTVVEKNIKFWLFYWCQLMNCRLQKKFLLLGSKDISLYFVFIYFWEHG